VEVQENLVNKGKERNLAQVRVNNLRKRKKREGISAFLRKRTPIAHFLDIISILIYL
jgi:hypothetical protein